MDRPTERLPAIPSPVEAPASSPAEAQAPSPASAPVDPGPEPEVPRRRIVPIPRRLIDDEGDDG